MKQVDPAGALANMLTGWWNKMTSNLHVAFPCKVVSFHEGSCTANIQPLVRSSASNPAVIQNVPVLGQRFMINSNETTYKPYLRAGDVVLVVCADREIKNVLTGKVAHPDSARMHSPNDAVIVGVFPCSL